MKMIVVGRTNESDKTRWYDLPTFKLADGTAMSGTVSREHLMSLDDETVIRAAMALDVEFFRLRSGQLVDAALVYAGIDGITEYRIPRISDWLVTE